MTAILAPTSALVPPGLELTADNRPREAAGRSTASAVGPSVYRTGLATTGSREALGTATEMRLDATAR